MTSDRSPLALPRPFELRLHWLLRFGCFACFVGHGAFGIITKAGWLPFFEVFGIGDAVAWKIMPVVGLLDIALGFWILLRPTRLVLAWMVFWTVFTALLRPLAGMGWWEFLERAGNYGVPLAFLLVALATQPERGWLGRLEPKPLPPDLVRRLQIVLTLTTATLLVGHGGFGAFQAKSMLADHYAAIGLPWGDMDPLAFVRLVGLVELVLAALVLGAPVRRVLLFAFAWKIGTELLYPISGDWGWEFVERTGSYVAPLALCALPPWAVTWTTEHGAAAGPPAAGSGEDPVGPP